MITDMPLLAPAEMASEAISALLKMGESPSLVLSALAEMKTPPCRMLFSKLSALSHRVFCSLLQVSLNISGGLPQRTQRNHPSQSEFTGTSAPSLPDLSVWTVCYSASTTG